MRVLARAERRSAGAQDNCPPGRKMSGRDGPLRLTLVSIDPNAHRMSTSTSGIEHELLQALLALEATVAALASAQPKPDLLPLFQKLDDLTRRLPTSTDPTLLHYLHKKSYEKARLFLQGREAENQRGNCRHV